MLRPHLRTANTGRASHPCLPPPLQPFFRMDREGNTLQRLLRLRAEDFAHLSSWPQRGGAVECRRTVALPIRFHAIRTEDHLDTCPQLLRQLPGHHPSRKIEDRNRHTPRSAPGRRPEAPALLRTFPRRNQSIGRPLPQRRQRDKAVNTFFSDLSFRWKTGSWQFVAEATNLFNKKQYSYTQYSATESYTSWIDIRPREFMASARYKF